MQSKANTKKTILGGGIVLCLVLGIVFVGYKQASSPLPASSILEPLPEPEVPVVIPKKEIFYHSITLTSTKPGAELVAAVGEANLSAVLSLNRVDIRHLQKDHVISIPDSFEDMWALSSFPKVIPELASVPKMMFIAQGVQEFGAYEYGVLVRFGGISTGKKVTPTTSKLFYANWKGKEVISTANDEWILKWNVNVDNLNGIGIHEYELPGYPASHSCIRFSASDAEWFYSWVENWVLSPEEQLLAQGTPVLVFGEYGFGQTAPWKKLVEDPKATTITLESLQEKITPLLQDINEKQEQRDNVIADSEGTP